jgi:hypothetical protein
VNCSMSVYILQVCFFLMASFNIALQLQGDFKICAGTFPAVCCLHVGSLDVGDAPTSDIKVVWLYLSHSLNIIQWHVSFP